MTWLMFFFHINTNDVNMYTCMTVITYVAIGDKTKKAGYNIEENVQSMIWRTLTQDKQ